MRTPFPEPAMPGFQRMSSYVRQILGGRALDPLHYPTPLPATQSVAVLKGQIDFRRLVQVHRMFQALASGQSPG